MCFLLEAASTLGSWPFPKSLRPLPLLSQLLSLRPSYLPLIRTCDDTGPTRGIQNNLASQHLQLNYTCKVPIAVRSHIPGFWGLGCGHLWGLYFIYHRRYVQRTLASIPASFHNRGNHSLNLHTVQFTLWCPVLWILANVSTCAPSPRGAFGAWSGLPSKANLKGGGGRWLEPNANRNSPRGGYILAGARCQSTNDPIHYSITMGWA